MNAPLAPPFQALSVSLLALLTLTGCSTVGPGDSAVKNLPENTIVIRNRTPYELAVMRNGVVWKRAEGQGRHAYQSPVRVMPQQELVLYNVASQPHKRITLGLDAVKEILLTPPHFSCVRGEELIGRHRFRVTLGTNNPPILVTVRGRGF